MYAHLHTALLGSEHLKMLSVFLVLSGPVCLFVYSVSFEEEVPAVLPLSLPALHSLLGSPRGSEVKVPTMLASGVLD